MKLKKIRETTGTTATAAFMFPGSLSPTTTTPSSPTPDQQRQRVGGAPVLESDLDGDDKATPMEIPDTPEAVPEDENTLLLKQAEAEKQELARRIEELETQMQARSSGPDEAQVQRLAEAEAERLKALELAEQLAAEKCVHD